MSLALASSIFTTSTTWDTLLIENEYTISCIFKLHVCVCTQLLSYVGVFVSPWAHQAFLFMEFSRKEYWSRLPFPTPGIFPTQELNLHLFVPPALVISFFTTAPPGKSSFFHRYIQHIKHILYAQEAKRETLPRPWTGSDLKEVNSLGPCNNTGHSPFLAPWS